MGETTMMTPGGVEDGNFRRKSVEDPRNHGPDHDLVHPHGTALDPAMTEIKKSKVVVDARSIEKKMALVAETGVSRPRPLIGATKKRKPYLSPNTKNSKNDKKKRMKRATSGPLLVTGVTRKRFRRRKTKN